MSSKQLTLTLNPKNPYTFEYFVPHSGIFRAFDTLKSLVDVKGLCFRVFFIFGPKGSGKTHLIHAIMHELKLSNTKLADKISVYENIETNLVGQEEDFIRSFINDYERKKSTGGIILITSEKTPSDISNNPHLSSRLLSAENFEITFPSESEIEPVVRSLLERLNLKFNDNNIKYLLERAPRDPLSLEQILAKIAELSLSQGKPAKRGFIKQVVES